MPFRSVGALQHYWEEWDAFIVPEKAYRTLNVLYRTLISLESYFR